MHPRNAVADPGSESRRRGLTKPKWVPYFITGSDGIDTGRGPKKRLAVARMPLRYPATFLSRPCWRDARC